MEMASPFYSSQSVVKDSFFLTVILNAWGLSSDLNGSGVLPVPLQLILNIPGVIRLM